MTDQPARPPQNKSQTTPQATPLRANFPLHVAEIVRFGDLDSQGHVNQAVYSTYFETGRVAMFRDKDLGIGVPGIGFVVARIEIDYLRELRWPNDIEVGTGIAALGRSSFTVAQAIFLSDVCHAVAQARLVCMDLTTRRSTPLTPALIEKLSRFKTGAAKT